MRIGPILTIIFFAAASTSVRADDGKQPDRFTISCAEIEAFNSQKRQHTDRWKEAVVQAEEAARLFKSGEIAQARTLSVEIGATVGRTYDSYNLGRGISHVRTTFEVHDANELVPFFANSMYRQIDTDKPIRDTEGVFRLVRFLNSYTALRINGYSITPDPFWYFRQQLLSFKSCKKSQFEILTRIAVPIRRWFDKDLGIALFERSERLAEEINIVEMGESKSRWQYYRTLARAAADTGDIELSDKYFASTALYLHRYKRQSKMSLSKAEPEFADLAILSQHISSKLERAKEDTLD